MIYFSHFMYAFYTYGVALHWLVKILSSCLLFFFLMHFRVFEKSENAKNLYIYIYIHLSYCRSKIFLDTSLKLVVFREVASFVLGVGLGQHLPPSLYPISLIYSFVEYLMAAKLGGCIQLSSNDIHFLK